MWEQIFGIANLVAMIAWAVLILAPRRDIVMRSLFFGPIFLLALGYATGLTLVLTGIVPTDGGADFSTIEGVRSIFASDAGVTIGWVHYLTFDLFVGLCVLSRADSLVKQADPAAADAVLVAETFARQARRRMARNVRGLDRNEDEAIERLAGMVLERGGYPWDVI